MEDVVKFFINAGITAFGGILFFQIYHAMVTQNGAIYTFVQVFFQTINGV